MVWASSIWEACPHSENNCLYPNLVSTGFSNVYIYTVSQHYSSGEYVVRYVKCLFWQQKFLKKICSQAKTSAQSF